MSTKKELTTPHCIQKSHKSLHMFLKCRHCSGNNHTHGTMALGDDTQPTQSAMQVCCILVLPDELLLQLFAMLPAVDLCDVMQTCRRFRALCSTRAVLASSSFASSWPSAGTELIYKRAADNGNFEAAIKLGVAYLYGEGVQADSESAGAMISLVSRLSDQPFVWLLFRPPWSSDQCAKADVFQLMQEMAMGDTAAGETMFCIAKTMSLQPRSYDVFKWYTWAAEAGCGAAAHEVVCCMRQQPVQSEEDKTRRVGLLQKHATSCNPSVLVDLCQEYVDGNRGAATHQQAVAFFRLVATMPSFKQQRIRQPDLDLYGGMRCILVDWLVEVIDLKGFSRDTLYMAVSIVDRFLQRCAITRKTLQLLGVTCMVIAARFLEKEVITIREAAWLTDNTYCSEQVVRMMGQVLAATQGQLRVLTQLDFVQLYLRMTGAMPATQERVHFVLDMALLYVPFGRYAPAQLAAACYVITMCSANSTNFWPVVLAEWTGLPLDEIAPCVIEVHKAIVHGKSNHGARCKAVQERYVRLVDEAMDEFVALATMDIESVLAL